MKSPTWLKLFLDSLSSLPLSLKKLFALDLVVGLFGFVSESAFVLILHSFLRSLDLIPYNDKIPNWLPTNLQSTSLILIAYGALRALLVVGKKMVPTVASHIVVRDIRVGIFNHFLLLKKTKDQNEIISDFNDSAFKAGQYLQYVFSIFENCIVLILVTGFSLKIAPYETISSYLLLILLLTPFTKYLSRAKALGEHQSKDYALVSMALIEGLKNLFLIRIYQTEEQEFKHGHALLQQHESRHTAHVISISLVSSFPMFAGVIVVTVISMLSKHFFQTPPVYLVAFLYLFIRSAQLASNLKAAISGAMFHEQAFRSMKPYLALSADNRAKIECFSSSVASIQIKVDSVSFSYNEGQKLISDLTFNSTSGDFILVKGPSGVGKSTLLQLLLGFETPKKGSVTISGLSPNEFLSSHAASIGYVGPEAFLATGTIKTNLCYGNQHNPSDKELWAALDQVGLKSTIERNSLGLETPIQTDVALSTGQKQRLSLARAILRQPTLLILDEATANIDLETERSIKEVLVALKPRPTIVAISHRDSFDDAATITLNFTGSGIIKVGYETTT